MATDILHHVGLVLDNEPDTYAGALDRVSRAFASAGAVDALGRTRTYAERLRSAEYAAGHALRDYVQELAGLGTDHEPTPMARELIMAALAGIEWSTLAADYAHDAREAAEGYAEGVAVHYGGNGHEEDTADELYGQASSGDWLDTLDCAPHEGIATAVLLFLADEYHAVSSGKLDRGECGHVLPEPGPNGRPTGRDWCSECGASVAVAS